MKAGAYDYLIKDPLGDYLTMLPATVENAINYIRVQQELKRYQEGLEKLVEERTVELEKTVNSLKESEQKYRTLIDGTFDIVISTDTDGYMTSWNRRAQQVFEYTDDEIIGKHMSILSSKELPDEQKEIMAEVQKKGFAEGIEIVQVTRDGSRIPVELTVSTMKDGAGHLIGFSAIMRNISERKKAEDELKAHRDHLADLVEERTAKLQESEARYRTVVEDQTELISRWKPDGTLIFVNERYCELFDKTREELIGTSIFSFVSEKSTKRLKSKITTLTPEQPSATDEYLSGSEERKNCWFRWTERGAFDKDGNLIAIQSVGRDITERKLAEEELRKRTEELEMFNKSMVDRELRIIEMKEEVNKLSVELGREPEYPPVWENDTQTNHTE